MGMLTIEVDINFISDGGPDRNADFARAETSVECLPDILTQVTAERCNQDIQWGGAEHDDEHTPLDWEAALDDHVRRLTVGVSGETYVITYAPAPDYRERLIKIAALACAAAQSWDRQNKKEG